MLIYTGKYGGKYKIYDTDDDTTSTIPEDELNKVKQLGIHILGLDREAGRLKLKALSGISFLKDKEGTIVIDSDHSVEGQSIILSSYVDTFVIPTSNVKGLTLVLDSSLKYTDIVKGLFVSTYLTHGVFLDVSALTDKSCWGLYKLLISYSDDFEIEGLVNIIKDKNNTRKCAFILVAYLLYNRGNFNRVSELSRYLNSSRDSNAYVLSLLKDYFLSDKDIALVYNEQVIYAKPQQLITLRSYIADLYRPIIASTYRAVELGIKKNKYIKPFFLYTLIESTSSFPELASAYIEEYKNCLLECSAEKYRN